MFFHSSGGVVSPLGVSRSPTDELLWCPFEGNTHCTDLC